MLFIDQEWPWYSSMPLTVSCQFFFFSSCSCSSAPRRHSAGPGRPRCSLLPHCCRGKSTKPPCASFALELPSRVKSLLWAWQRRWMPLQQVPPIVLILIGLLLQQSAVPFEPLPSFPGIIGAYISVQACRGSRPCSIVWPCSGVFLAWSLAAGARIFAAPPGVSSAFVRS